MTSDTNNKRENEPGFPRQPGSPDLRKWTSSQSKHRPTDSAPFGRRDITTTQGVLSQRFPVATRRT